MKRRSLGRVLGVAVVVLLAASTSHAQTTWDLRGDWTIEGSIEEGLWGADFDVTSENFSLGTFNGPSDYTSGSYVAGQITGSDISFGLFDIYGERTFNGSIAAEGTMSGSMVDESGIWHGNFWTVAGDAVQVPEPATASMLLIASAGILMRRRRRQLA